MVIAEFGKRKGRLLSLWNWITRKPESATADKLKEWTDSLWDGFHREPDVEHLEANCPHPDDEVKVLVYGRTKSGMRRGALLDPRR
jgi:hypothetical protein